MSLGAFQIHFGWFLESFVQLKRFSELFLVLEQILAIFVDHRQSLVYPSQVLHILSTDWRISFWVWRVLRIWSNFRHINMVHLPLDKFWKGFRQLFRSVPFKIVLFSFTQTVSYFVQVLCNLRIKKHSFSFITTIKLHKLYNKKAIFQTLE